MLRPFLLALQFLTRLPAPNLTDITDREIGLSQYYYPLVGLIIGLILLLSAHFISLPSSGLEAALLLTIWVLITGALHIDGLADCADAWVGGYGDKDKTLAIMKDPQSGPVAVTLVACVLLIKFTALEVIIENEAWSVLILSTVISRSLLPVLFHTTPYVRTSGLGSALNKHQSISYNILIQTLSLLLSFILIGISAVIVIAVIFALFYLIRYLSIKRIGGITGDVAGALVELSEIAIMLTVLATAI